MSQKPPPAQRWAGLKSALPAGSGIQGYRLQSQLADYTRAMADLQRESAGIQKKLQNPAVSPQEKERLFRYLHAGPEGKQRQGMTPAPGSLNHRFLMLQKQHQGVSDLLSALKGPLRPKRPGTSPKSGSAQAATPAPDSGLTARPTGRSPIQPPAPGSAMQSVDATFNRALEADIRARPQRREEAKFQQSDYWNPVFRKPGGTEGFSLLLPDSGYHGAGTSVADQSYSKVRLPQFADPGRVAQKWGQQGKQEVEDQQEARFYQKWAERAAQDPRIQLPYLGATREEQEANSTHINAAMRHFDAYREQVWNEFSGALAKNVEKKVGHLRGRELQTFGVLMDVPDAKLPTVYEAATRREALEQAPQLAEGFGRRFDPEKARAFIEKRTGRPMTPLQLQALRAATGWEAHRLPDKLRIEDEGLRDAVTTAAVTAVTGGAGNALGFVDDIPGVKGAGARVLKGGLLGAGSGVTKRMLTPGASDPNLTFRERMEQQLLPAALGGAATGAGTAFGKEVLGTFFPIRSTGASGRSASPPPSSATPAAASPASPGISRSGAPISQASRAAHASGPAKPVSSRPASPPAVSSSSPPRTGATGTAAAGPGPSAPPVTGLRPGDRVIVTHPSGSTREFVFDSYVKKGRGIYIRNTGSPNRRGGVIPIERVQKAPAQRRGGPRF